MTALADKTTRLDGYDILVLSPTPTWPLDFGNRKRIYEVCNRFKQRGARIHFVHYASEGDWRGAHPREATLRMQEQWDYNYTIAPSIDLHNEAQGEDHTIDEWWDPVLDSQLRWLFSAHSFDAVIVNYTWLSRALDFAPENTYKILDTHDRFSGRGDLLVSNSIAKEFFHTTIAEEVKGLQRADLVWAIKAEEEAFFRTVLPEDSNTQVRTLLHGELPVEAGLRRQPDDDGCLTVGLIGGRNNINMVNTRNFLDAALPLFEQYMAPIKLLLAGSMCDDLHDIEHPNVELMGRVETVAEFYAAVDLVVVPMTFSTGLKIKVAEAFSYGVATIGHHHGFEGYPVEHALHQLQSIEEVALACVDLAFEPGTLSEIAAAGDEANLRIIAEVEQEAEATAADIVANLPAVIYVLPQGGLAKTNLEYFHSRAIIDFLSWTYKVILYFPGEVDDRREAMLSELAMKYPVYVQAASRASGCITAVDDLASILESHDVQAVWTKEPSGLGLLGDDICVVSDQCFSASAVTDSDGYDIRLVTVPEHTLLDARNVYFMPFGHVDTTSFFRHFSSFGGDSGKILILLSGSSEQVRFEKGVVQAVLGEWFELYWCQVGDDEAYLDSNERTIAAAEFAANFLSMAAHYRSIINLNHEGSPLLNTLSMLFDSIGSPVLQASNISGFDLWTHIGRLVDFSLRGGGSKVTTEAYQAQFFSTWSNINRVLDSRSQKRSMGF